MPLLDLGKYEKNVPLAQRVSEKLREMIIDGTLEKGEQLPNEIELAEQFNVSRSTIRAALQTLERFGFVSRRRGIGTFISKEPMFINNLSLNWGISQVINSSGAKPGTAELNVYYDKADEHTAKRLEISEEDEILVIQRVRTADDRKVAYTLDIISMKILNSLFSEDFSNRKMYNYLKEKQSLYSLIQEKLKKPIHHAVAHISPIVGERNITEKLNLPEGSAVLYIEQVDYTSNDEPIWLAKEHHVANAFTFSVYRMM